MQTVEEVFNQIVLIKAFINFLYTPNNEDEATYKYRYSTLKEAYEELDIANAKFNKLRGLA
ncbi:hypothetical protein MUDAN_BIHEEGNE_02261 [Lactiplantibacillus mudanjiangensis]|uniref:hypothetical protein n=1 Tax=Lactiplantibacillus mudanjiangensis TaxID=1296538 RepID=UPI0010152370|nr:hypothetical protein MUDAN_BIHEEGNE_02261 [Lactiplantibacillus mudanjiangensis]